MYMFNVQNNMFQNTRVNKTMVDLQTSHWLQFNSEDAPI